MTHEHEISGSYGGEYEDHSFLGYIAPMKEPVSTSETSVYFKWTTWR
jgi:hypothetical protein